MNLIFKPICFLELIYCTVYFYHAVDITGITMFIYPETFPLRQCNGSNVKEQDETLLKVNLSQKDEELELQTS